MNLAERREARRKKILENIDSRLKKITGVEERSTKSEIDVFHHLQVEENADSAFINQINLSHSNYSALSTSSTNRYSENVHNGELLTSSNKTALNQIGWNGYPRYYYIVIISVIYNLLLIICNILIVDVEYLHLNKIFIPLIAFEILYLYFGSNYNETPTFLSSILALSNLLSFLNPVYLHSGQQLINFMFRLTQDMMVYFLIFIVWYTLLNVFI